MRYLICKTLFALLILWTPQASAQELMWNYYEALTKRLLKTEIGAPYDFTNLRGFYTGSAYYDPDGQDAIEGLSKSFQAYQQTQDKAHIIAFENKLRRHFGNLGVVNYARNIVSANPRFGDMNFLTWVADGLQKSMLASGDGQSLRTSYNILNLGEETNLIQVLNVDVIDQQTQKAGVIYYSIYDAIDRTTGQKRILFLDLTTPLTWLEKEMEVKQEPLPFFR